MNTITLLLGVHAHQPVGNFPEVIDEAHERCYRPFLQTMARFPEFRFSAHFSGWLLEYLGAKYPDDMQLLAAMVRRGQVEMFGAGEYEPVLASIPHRDRVAQIEALSARLERDYGVRPQGAWLTERVWEASIVPSLAASGVRYVVVDDYHFLASGRDERELGGHFTTEEGGDRLDLFPILEQLRYRLPFAPAEECVAYLESLADQGRAAAVYFDDIEKFGIWPETFDWVYGRKWLERFVTAVLASGKVRTATFAQFHASHRTRGIVYLPSASYIEMNEWTLGGEAAARYIALAQSEKARGALDRNKAFVRGGIWRNFLSRYPESNWMHKRMVALSARVAALPAPDADASRLLMRAQANDAYWHGLFGGLYLPHLRRAIWNAIVALEARLDALAPRSGLERFDLDCDAVDEVFVRDAAVQAVVRDDGRASVIELDSYPLAHNFGDTLRRSAEPYHAQVLAAGSAHDHGGEGIASAHDRVTSKHPIDASDLVPDATGRHLFLDAIATGDADPEPLSAYSCSAADAAGASFVDWPRRIEKHIAADGGAITVRYRFAGGRTGRFVTELNLAMPSADGFAGRYILHDGSIPCGFGQDLRLDAAASLALDDGVLGGALHLECDPPAALEAQAFRTVSRSEAGFEMVMQGVVLRLAWAAADAGDITVVLRPRAHASP